MYREERQRIINEILDKEGNVKYQACENSKSF